jgi:anti-sigma B factor antagonist
MIQVETIRVVSAGMEQTVSLSPSQLNNLESARQTKRYLTELLSSRSMQSSEARLNLCFKAIHHLNSTGLNQLIGINAQARLHGVQLVLVDVQESIRQVFAVTRLERMFEFSSSHVTT